MTAESLAAQVACLESNDRSRLVAALSDLDCEALLHDWQFWGRRSQMPPIGDWFCWLVMAGRGFGKTRMGVEWLRSQVEGPSPLKAPKGAPERIALVADSFLDGVQTMVEGESGLMACCPDAFRPHFEVSKKRLVWPNGIQAFLYSSEAPDQLRGPQHALAWADEIAKWSHVEETWDNLLFGLRLGEQPRVMVTTTPRNIPLLRKLMEDEKVCVTRGNTYDNSANLPDAFLAEIRQRYEGTRIGRQELYGELLIDIEGALWSRDLLDGCRIARLPELSRIVVAVDPPVSSGPDADQCGIIVAGRDLAGQGYVLRDETIHGVGPLDWASRAIKAYHEFNADRLVAEVNNGGDLVESLIRQIDPEVSYLPVRASRGKTIRAEPVAALYEQGRIFHHGIFPELEEEMCGFSQTEVRKGKSPDRVDALVWALTDLLLRRESRPRIRQIIY
ncbi:DNA-packaging protein [Emcibacter nanhaiensis]|uniref:ATP-binding protein n=1 Tax=Emcibacter nanhaiensis TaxID=1505037 RepID=A0A501PCR2_9PROT|nr:terminase family protein [Emcibacter nanhaiensis]TPD57756.1 ATP-binding protein [Emcibacter nanhaiensis]